MKNLAHLREQRNSHVTEMRNLLDNNKENWTGEIAKKYEEHDLAVANLDSQIKAQQRQLDLDAESHFGLQDGLPAAAAAALNAAPRNGGQLKQVWDKWLRRGDNALTADDWALVRNTMSTTTPAEGGYTVQTDVASQIVDAMKDYSALRASGLAEIIRTAQGNPISFPTSDGTAEEGEIIPENGSATDDDIDFGVLNLGVYKFSSKVVTVPIELLQDSTANIEAFVTERLGQRLGRITERKFTLGSGSNEPRGVITASLVGVVGASGNISGITYDNLVDLEHSVNRAYRSNDCAFMMNDNSLKVVRKIKDGQGRPIFVPGYETGVPGGAPDTLLGRRLVINEMMADFAANAKPVAFGNFSYYKIRDVMDMTLFRFTDSAYTKKGQVGFLAWSRHGGNLIDVGGAVKTFQNAAS